MKTLYIEADEDHIHLQNGKSAIVKLVYVHEGARFVNIGRQQLINAHFFASATDSTDTMWNNVADYVYKNYYGLKHEIAGDGAAWIKSGLNYIPTAAFKLDKFHTCKAIRTAAYGDKRIAKMIIDAVKNEDRETIKTGFKLLSSKADAQRDRVQRKTILENKQYILGNLDVIDMSNRNCCSAEGHVSHMLSARMSSRPMGWGAQGADRIARLRAFLFNDGNFEKLLNAQEKFRQDALKSKDKDNGRPLNVGVATSKSLSESIFECPASVVGLKEVEWFSSKKFG